MVALNEVMVVFSEII